MQIHTVKPGDTIFKIARQYSASPMKIIENNSLENPDRLSVGQELLILTPTRTYTVRGGDTLSMIADRFGIEYNDILRNNPYLCGTDKIYPGQLISLKYDTPKYGMAAANGYYTKGCSKERLDTALPYLSYITICAGKWNGKDIERLFDDSAVMNLSKEKGVIPLLRVYASEIFGEEEALSDNLLLLAKTHGYGGITLAAYSEMKKDAEKFADFLLTLKKRMMENDLLLFCEIDGNSEIPDIKDISDGYIMMYERPESKKLKAGEAEETLLNMSAEIFEPSKTYLEIPTHAHNNDSKITIGDAVKIATNGGKEIICDGDNGICSFEHNKYRGSKKDILRTSWESLESIKAKLRLVGELGLMGISFDINTVPTEYLMMLEAMFRHTPNFRRI